MRKHDSGHQRQVDTQAAVRAVIAAAIEERERQARKILPPSTPPPRR
jgi:hypothetical protein